MKFYTIFQITDNRIRATIDFMNMEDLTSGPPAPARRRHSPNLPYLNENISLAIIDRVCHNGLVVANSAWQLCGAYSSVGRATDFYSVGPLLGAGELWFSSISRALRICLDSALDLLMNFH
jgi:hypothetical protein